MLNSDQKLRGGSFTTLLRERDSYGTSGGGPLVSSRSNRVKSAKRLSPHMPALSYLSHHVLLLLFFTEVVQDLKKGKR